MTRRRGIGYTVPRMHADVDAVASWAAFERSPFFQHVPRCTFPHEPWTLERVRMVLRHFCDDTTPGMRGIPITV